MHLHALSPARGSRRPRKRVARGNSAGGGTTAGRGSKGQDSRTGTKRRLGFEGGQTPLMRRQPKLKGFTNHRRTSYEVVNLPLLEAALEAGSYDAAALREHKILRTKKPVKILGHDGLTKKFFFTVDAASKGAKEAIEKAGGTVNVSHS